MSSKLRRQKDIIKNSTQSYLDAVTDYQEYYEGSSPILITYYQISDEQSRTDTSLEDVHEVVGASSSLKYNRIKHLPARGMPPLDISTELTQRGLESFTGGEFVLSPSAGIFPRSGEFFTYEDDVCPDLNQHLFIITDVQYDKMTSSQKFFKCTFKVYPLNADNIYGSINKKYVYSPSGPGNQDGVGDSILITEEENEINDSIQEITDGLIDKFEELFYDEGMDTFAFQKPLDQTGTNFEYYWLPYVCHFIYKNNILEKSNREFLTEIFVQDINEREFPNIYSEEGYRNSIFYATEVQDAEILDKPECEFLEVSAYDLSKPLNLPFFTSAETYHLLEGNHRYNVDFWYGAFNWLYDDTDHLYTNIDGYYKHHEPLIKYLSQDDGCYDPESEKIKVECEDKILNHTFYQLEDNSTDISKIKKMIRIPKKELMMDPYDCRLDNIINAVDMDEYPDLGVLFNIIRDYIKNKDYRISTKTLNELNNEYYDNSLKNYLLLPLVIYILQNSKGTVEDDKKNIAS